MKKDYLLELAKIIKATRKEENVSVKDLAERMNCSPSYIRMVESGIQGISLRKLLAFATALDRDLFIDFPKKKNYPS